MAVADLDRIDADLVELRLDYLDDLEKFPLEDFLPRRNRLILTVRDPEEGGVSEVEPARKVKSLTAAIEKGFMVDVEGTFVEKEKIDCRGMIVSRHFFRNEPDSREIEEFVERYSSTASIVKIALKSSPSSRIKLLELLRKYQNLAVMELDGESSTRLLFSLLGSKLLYCHLGEKTSPGQIGCPEAMQTLELFRKW